MWHQTEKNHYLSAVNNPKNDLMHILNRLESLPRCKTAAKELGSIIGRLEHWQNRHKTK